MKVPGVQESERRWSEGCTLGSVHSHPESSYNDQTVRWASWTSLVNWQVISTFHSNGVMPGHTRPLDLNLTKCSPLTLPYRAGSGKQLGDGVCSVLEKEKPKTKQLHRSGISSSLLETPRGEQKRTDLAFLLYFTRKSAYCQLSCTPPGAPSSVLPQSQRPFIADTFRIYMGILK